MVLLRLTKQDINSGKVVKPGRYYGTISDVEIKPAKTDGSTTFRVSIIGESGEAESVRFLDIYSEKWMGRFRPLLEALGCEMPADDADLEVDTDALLQKRVGLDVDNELNNGVLRNRIKGYFKAS